MEIKITVLNTSTLTNEITIKDYVITDVEWEDIDMDISPLESEEAQATNEYFNAFSFLYYGFQELLNLQESSDFEDNIEDIFPFYTASDQNKRKRGYIYDLKERDGIKTRIILFAPKNYLPSIL